MRKVKELTLGVIIFFIVERMALLISGHAIERTAEIDLACRRAMIELVFLIGLLAGIWYLLKA
jgi:hypothetical protein